MKDLSILAKIIRDARHEHHYTQSGLAVRCQLAPSYISKIESNQLHYPPSKEAIASLATVLELDEYRISLMAGHIPDGIAPLVFKFLCAYPEERAKEILEKAFLTAFF